MIRKEAWWIEIGAYLTCLAAFACMVANIQSGDRPEAIWFAILTGVQFAIWSEMVSRDGH